MPGSYVNIDLYMSTVDNNDIEWIFKHPGRKVESLKKSFDRFHFANTSFEFVCRVFISLAEPPVKQPKYIITDIIPADILSLHKLHNLNREFLIAVTIANRQTKQSSCCAESGTKDYYKERDVLLFRSCIDHVYVKMGCYT